MNLETRQQVAEAVQAVESKKAEEIAILEMDRNSGAFTDYFVLCSGTNPRQIQAISDEVEKRLAEMGRKPTSVEGYNQAEWVLLDYLDFVVHIFSERARRFYDLERLWKSARRLAVADLLKKPAARAARKAAPSKSTKVKSKPRRTSMHAKKESRKPKSRGR